MDERQVCRTAPRPAEREIERTKQGRQQQKKRKKEKPEVTGVNRDTNLGFINIFLAEFVCIPLQTKI